MNPVLARWMMMNICTMVVRDAVVSTQQRTNVVQDVLSARNNRGSFLDG